jgi:predicted methyltransferase
MKLRSLAAALVALSCSQAAAPPAAAPEGTTAAEGSASAPEGASQLSASERLDAVLAAQPEEAKARYPQRHPKETLEFFGIEPGMTVVDTLPGEVFYSGILLDYLGTGGKVVLADYSPQMWTQFGDYSPDPKTKATWAKDILAQWEPKRGPDDAALAAFQYGSVPDDLAGSVDVVLLVRAVHHFMRLESNGGYMSAALADINKLLKPGGIVGVEQHRAPEKNSDAWAKGDAGYVKQSAVIAAFQKAGLELVGSSEVNANPKDQPTEKDMVWRLPPTLAMSKDKPEHKAQMEAIGESDRMTLKFKKPS